MKNLVFTFFLLALAISCKKESSYADSGASSSTSYLTYQGKKYPFTQLIVEVDTLFGEFWNNHLYSYYFIYLSPEISVVHDGTEITESHGKGDALFFEMVSDQEPPKNGIYDFELDAYELNKMSSISLGLGFDADSFTVDKEIELTAGQTASCKFTVIDAAQKIYKTELSTPEFNGIFERRHVVLKAY